MTRYLNLRDVPQTIPVIFTVQIKNKKGGKTTRKMYANKENDTRKRKKKKRNIQNRLGQFFRLINLLPKRFAVFISVGFGRNL